MTRTGTGEPPRLGLIGLGPWGQKIAACLRDLDPTLLRAVATGNPTLAHRLTPEARIFGDGPALIDSGTVDGVIIATPPATHGRLALAAIRADLPVLIEKPMATVLDEAETLRDMALARRAIVQINHLDLAHPAFRAVDAARPAIAPVIRMTGRITRRISPNPMADALWDFAPHLVAIALTLAAAAPVAIRARRTRGSGLDRLAFRLSFPAAPPFIGLAGFGFGADARRVRLYGDDGRLTYDDRAADKAVMDRHGEHHRLAGPDAASPLHTALSQFINQIRSKLHDPAPVLVGYRVVQCLGILDTMTRQPAP